MKPNKKCKHSIEWDDKSLHRPNPKTNDLFILMGKCKYCGWDFKKQYMHDLEVMHDYDLNLGMPYDLSNYDQIMKNIHTHPYGPIIPFYEIDKETLK